MLTMPHLDTQTTDPGTGAGMVAEDFGGSPLDTVCAGARGDDNAVVILDILANVKWTADGGVLTPPTRHCLSVHLPSLSLCLSVSVSLMH